MKSNRMRLARWAVLSLIPLGVLFNLALAISSQSIDWSAFPYSGLTLALCLAIAPWSVAACRVMLWTRFTGDKLGFLVSLRSVLGGLIGSAITPTISGAGTIKWGLTTRHGVAPGVAASMVALETFEELIFFAVALPCVLLLATTELDIIREAVSQSGIQYIAQLQTTGLVVLLVVATATLLGWAGFSGLLGDQVQHRTRRGFARVRGVLSKPLTDARGVLADVAKRGRMWLVAGLGLTALQWALRYSVAWAVLRAFNIDVPPLLSWAMQWLTHTFAGVVPTPGAAGGAEAAFALIYAPFIPFAELGLAVSSWRLTLYYIPLAIAGMLLLIPWGRSRK